MQQMVKASFQLDVEVKAAHKLCAAAELMKRQYDEQFSEMRASVTRDKNKTTHALENWKTSYANLMKRYTTLMHDFNSLQRQHNQVIFEMATLKQTNAVATNTVRK